MAWSERQRRMLVELGLPPWVTPATTQAGSVAAEREPVSFADGDAHADPLAASLADIRSTRAATAPAALAGALKASPTVAPTTPPAAPSAAGPALRGLLHADLGWTELRDKVASCTACGLCRGRTQTVFGVGNQAAHWMIVGEAPGEQEDRLGEPFVGRSGQLLDNMLLALGLTRVEDDPSRQVFIANALKCRPPGNRNPTPEELATCEPFLIRQVALVRPRIILAMGRFAVQSLLRSSEPIGRLRGKVHRYQGVPLVVTYHPAYLLRNPLEKARAWDDLCLAAATLAESGQAAAAQTAEAPD